MRHNGTTLVLSGLAVLLSVSVENLQALELVDWQLSTSVRSDYNSSWLFIDPDVLDTSQFAPAAELDGAADFVAGRWVFSVEASGSHVELSRDSLPDDLQQYNATARLARDWEYGLTSVSVTVEDQSLLLSALTPDGFLGVTDSLNRRSASLSHLHQLSERASVSVFLRGQDLDFSDRFTTVNRDKYRVTGAGMSFRYETSEYQTMSLSLLVDEIDTRSVFPVAFGPFQVATLLERKTLLYGPALSLEKSIGRHWTLDSTASVRRRETVSKQQSLLGLSRADTAEWDIFGDVRLRRSFEHGWLAIGYSRAFRPSESVAAQLAERDNASITVNRQLSSRLSGQVGAVWIKDALSGSVTGATQRSAWQVNGWLNWQVSERVSTRLSARYQSQSLGDNTVDDLDRSLASIRLRYALGRGR